jgi:hypothetical protein
MRVFLDGENFVLLEVRERRQRGRNKKWRITSILLMISFFFFIDICCDFLSSMEE